MTVSFFQCSWTDKGIVLTQSNAGKETIEIPWKDITKICFEATDIYSTDNMHIYFNNSKEKVVIPLDSEGGHALWDEIVIRKLFDEIKANELRFAEDRTICHPE